jgi:hypothetical protein
MKIYILCELGSDYRVIESTVQYQQLLSDQYTVCSELKSDVGLYPDCHVRCYKRQWKYITLRTGYDQKLQFRQICESRT